MSKVSWEMMLDANTELSIGPHEETYVDGMLHCFQRAKRMQKIVVGGCGTIQKKIRCSRFRSIGVRQLHSRHRIRRMTSRNEGVS